MGQLTEAQKRQADAAQMGPASPRATPANPRHGDVDPARIPVPPGGSVGQRQSHTGGDFIAPDTGITPIDPPGGLNAYQWDFSKVPSPEEEAAHRRTATPAQAVPAAPTAPAEPGPATREELNRHPIGPDASAASTTTRIAFTNHDAGEAFNNGLAKGKIGGRSSGITTA